MKLNNSLKFVMGLILLAVVIAVGRKVVKQTASQGNLATSPKRIAMMVKSFTPKGWELYDTVMQFTPENLYEHINGRAEYYLAYDVIGMTFASFEKSTDKGFWAGKSGFSEQSFGWESRGFPNEVRERATSGEKGDNSSFINLSIYDMGTPTNAFGVFSGERSLEAPRVKLGRDAYRMGANYYIFQGQYYIQIIAADDELQQLCMDLAERVTDLLQDSGQPEGFWVGKSGFSERSEEKGDIWGLITLPKTNRLPQSVQYFLSDALGLDFMRNTYTAKYYKGKIIVSIFLSRQDSPDSARTTITKFKEHATMYGKKVDILSVDGIELVSCDMGRSYDVVFQKGHLVAGVTEVKDKKLAVEATIDLWKQLQTE